MFLTGFDSPTLNTLYVDKNLKYHSLIQAFSRTNRILNERKSQGNIVCFRNLKKETDDAITLFSNKDAKEIVLIDSFESYLKKFNEVFEKLIQLVPSVDCVNDLQTDEAKFGFVKIFRDLIRLKNVLESFYDFDISKTEIDVQTFEDYKSKYLDIYNSIIRPGKEKVSILDDVDFELELIKKDEINLDYILALLANLKDKGEEFVEAQKKVIF
jgi:type I restriction enzyme R subunit